MLKALKIENVRDCPDVFFDKESNHFEISGRSLLINPIDFSIPLNQWVDEYIKDPNPEMVIILKFEYINSASIRMIVDLLTRFRQGCPEDTKMEVVWYIEEDDEIMKERGEEIQNVVKIPFSYKMLEE